MDAVGVRITLKDAKELSQNDLQELSAQTRNAGEFQTFKETLTTLLAHKDKLTSIYIAQSLHQEQIDDEDPYAQEVV